MQAADFRGLGGVTSHPIKNSVWAIGIPFIGVLKPCYGRDCQYP
jgi:hypothetical protein